MRRPSRLRLARIESGYTLYDVYRRTGIRESRLSRVERQQAPLDPDDLEQLARVYGRPPEDLLDVERPGA